MIRKGVRVAGGAGLVLLGLLGLMLPVMPGWVFLIPGLIILGEYFPPIRRLVEWAKAKALGPSGATGGTTPDGRRR